MTKQELIDAHINSPFKVGELVYVRGLGSQNKNSIGDLVKILSINDTEVSYKYSGRVEKCPLEYLTKYTRDIGYDPIPVKNWNSNIKYYSYDLQGILNEAGFSIYDLKFEDETVLNFHVPNLNWNPFIIKDNQKLHYQREFCWNLEQKQSLISSIYNNIHIGTFLFKVNNYEVVEQFVKESISCGFRDIVDGKQRLDAIIEFVTDVFPDFNGHYFSEFSEASKRKFFSFNQTSCGLIQGEVSNDELLKIFLNVNYTGVQMSKEHIQYVQSLL